MRIMRDFLATAARHTRNSVLAFQLPIVASACFVVGVMTLSAIMPPRWALRMASPSKDKTAQRIVDVAAAYVDSAGSSGPAEDLRRTGC